jgi:hypothetical protein
MNVGSTSVVPRTCFAGRFLGWMLTVWLQQCKRGTLQRTDSGGPIDVQLIASKSPHRRVFICFRSVNGKQAFQWPRQSDEAEAH